MAKSPRTILFLSPDATRVLETAIIFQAASNRLGLPWIVRTQGIADSADELFLANVDVLVALDLPDYPPPASSIRFERMTSSLDLEHAVNSLLARLLGGSDAPVSPKQHPSPPPKPQKIHTVKVSRETAGRKGKGVTVVSDLPLDEQKLKELATQLKNKCGTGGTAKDGRIEIQGDHRDKLVEELEKLGYKVKRAGE
jgi:translation initiation factor 1